MYNTLILPMNLDPLGGYSRISSNYIFDMLIVLTCQLNDLSGLAGPLFRAREP